jgi:hypothetical protein
MDTIYRRGEKQMAKYGKFWMKIVLMGKVGILLCGANAVAADIVTRKELGELVAEHLRSTLTKHEVKDEEKVQTVQQSEAIVARISRLVEKLPGQEISDQMAEWIVTSLVDLVGHRGEVLLVGDNRSQSLMDSLEAQAKKVLSGLDKERSEALISRRDKLTKESEEFWGKMLRYVAHRLSEPQVFRVTLSNNPEQGQLLKVVESLRKEAGKNTVPDKKEEAQHRARLDKLDSRLLTLSLVREVAIIMKDQATKNYFGTHNLFSLAYDVEVRQGTLNPAKFEDMFEEIDDLYRRTVRIEGETAELYLPNMQEFISAVKRIRWGDKSDFSQASSRAKEYVEFQNEEQLWRLLEIEVEGSGE